MDDNQTNGKIKMPPLQSVPALIAGTLLIVVALQWFGSPSPIAAQGDSAAPTVSSVAITSNPDDDIREDVPYWAGGVAYNFRPSGIYGIGDDIEVTVTFNEDVTVTGAPKLDLNIGGTLKAAGYLSAEDSAVVFRYTVAEGDSDTNGVAIDANKLRLNGGSIRDAADNNADLSHDALAVQTDHRVDGIRPRISLRFLGPNSYTTDGFLTVGERILVSIEASASDSGPGFMGPAFDSASGPPQLMLDFDGEEKAASWDSGNLGELFEYVIQEGDLDADGVAIKANSISLNGGFIKDQAGNDAILTHSALPADREHRVDAVSPTVTSVAITSDPGEDDTYGTGDKIEVTVTFSEYVKISNVYRNGREYRRQGPSLELDIGGEARTADYQNRSGPTALVFAYNVRAGDSDENGISIGANKLHLNDGCIYDFARNNPISATEHCGARALGTVVSHDALADDSGHKVTGSSSTLTVTGPTTLAYRENEGLYYVNDPEKYVGRYGVSGNGDNVSWSLSGDDESLFSLEETDWNAWKTLWFNSPPNYEDPEDADADNVYRVTIEASDGTNTSALEVVVEVTNDWFDSDEFPVITGTIQVGETLAVDLSRISDPWGPSNAWTRSYQWIRTNGTTDTDIDGANASTYTLTADDRGHRIKVRVYLSAVYWSTGATNTLLRFSEPSAAVPAPGQTNSRATGAAAITGTAKVGQTLTADTSGISDSDGMTTATFSYQWLADDADISGATSSTYTLAAADAGKAIKVRVSFTDDAGNNETLTSAATVAVVPLGPDLASLSLIFSGKPSTYVGGTLNFSAGLRNQGGSASTATTLRYYQSTDSTIDTSDTEVGTDDVAALSASESASVSEELTAPDTAGTYYFGACVDAVAGESDTTNNCSSGFEILVLAWNSPATGQPTISGTPQVGNTLRADTSGISDDDGLANAIFNHRWLADGTNIPGATGSSYTLADADAGKAVKVRTSFTDDAGNDEILTSAATAAVVASQPEVTGVAVSSLPASGDTYALGETIRIRVTFSEAVAATGSPQLNIDMDPAHWGTKWAAYESGSGTTELVFAHTVVEPNFSAQGIAVLENTLELNGGAIASTTTEAGADLSHTGLEHDPSHKVDWQANRAPVFHGTAQVLDNALPGFLVSLPILKTDFRDPDGDPLTFALSASRDDVYASHGDVPGGFLHSERVGRIFFLAKTACALADLDPPTGDAYYTVISMTAADPDGATANATATFRTDPAAFGCPSLSSATADGATLTMVFDADLAPSFTEPAAHEFVVKADGVPVSVAEVSLGDADTGSDSGETISLTGDTISLTLAAPVEAGQTVTVSYAPGDSPVVAAFTDRPAANDTTVPTVTAVSVVSDPGDDDTYGLNDVITISVTFDEAVDVTGAPHLKIDMDPAEWGEKWASYQSGSGTAALTFAHTVVEPNISTQGIAVLANTLELNGGDIESAATDTDADLSHTGLGHDSNHKVDWQQQQQQSPNSPATGAPAITGTARVRETLTADTTGISDSDGLTGATFSYQWVAADADISGATGSAYTLATTDQGKAVKVRVSFTDDAGHAETLTSAATAAVAAAKPPAVTAVAIVSDPGDDDTYAKDDVIRIRVTFDEAVDVDTSGGTPRLKLKMDPNYGEKWTNYASGTGSTALIFTFTVVEPNYSPQGIAVLANTLELNGGDIESVNTDADADLSHSDLAHDSGHKVDWQQ